MLLTIDETRERIQQGEILFLAADAKLLAQLPKGRWVGGSIPYFMSEKGGINTQEHIFATVLPDYVEDVSVQYYSDETLPNIANDAPENGFSLIIIPATSPAHVSYAENAPNYPNLFFKPILGWIAGVQLEDLSTHSACVFNGRTADSSESEAVVMHVSLAKNKMAIINILNIFEQSDGDDITFEEEGFSVKECYINGEKRNFAEYLQENTVDTRYPLVADYCGAMVNVSFQGIDEAEQKVNLYAPVFEKVTYKLAKPITNYISDFEQALPQNMQAPLFSCNCILNYLYSELEGKNTGEIQGPITFGEIAYQLLNQTMVYLDIQDFE